MRKAQFAGQFYPSNKEELTKLIEYYLNKYLNDSKERSSCYGIISPHAGYTYCGNAVGKAYAELTKSLEKGKKYCFFIFGTNHTGLAYGYALTLQDFETPLGVMKINSIAMALAKFSECELNDNAHRFEHSIEVQLPFLQYITQKSNIEATIVPIIAACHKIDSIKQFAQKIVKLIETYKINARFIASSDFTHYGIAYNFLPSKDVKEKIHTIDKKAIEYIINMQTEKFLSFSKTTTICGTSAIATIMEIARLLNKKPKLLVYTTSGEVAGYNINAVVGYAAIGFY